MHTSFNTQNSLQWNTSQPDGDGTAAYWSSEGYVFDTSEVTTDINTLCVQKVINVATGKYPCYLCKVIKQFS